MSDPEIFFKNPGGEGSDSSSPSTRINPIGQEELINIRDSVELLKAQSIKFNEFMDFMMSSSSNDCESGATILESPVPTPLHEESSDIIDSDDNVVGSQLKDTKTDPFLRIKEKYSNKEKLGKPVDDNLAALVNTMMTSQQSPDQIKELKSNILRPENTPFLVAPQVNKEIWEMIPQDSQQADVKYQKIQQNIVQGITPIIECLDSKDVSEDIKKKLMDSLTLLTNAQMEMNNFRRSELKPKMKSAKGLVHREVPITSQLFGDDLEGEIKKMEQKKKLSSSVSSYSSSSDRQQRRFHPYSSFQNFKDKAKSFLGREGLSRQGSQFQPPQSRYQSQRHQSFKNFRGKKRN